MFTHSIDNEGFTNEDDSLYQDWDNVKLLDGKKERLDQFLVWNDNKEYFILLGKKGTEFDNL